jgi:hypothetical protein
LEERSKLPKTKAEIVRIDRKEEEGQAEAVFPEVIDVVRNMPDRQTNLSRVLCMAENRAGSR